MVPIAEAFSYSVHTLGCECSEYFIFYMGSYKAILESYETLLHMEKILSKVMKNPLVKSVKFCIH